MFRTQVLGGGILLTSDSLSHLLYEATNLSTTKESASECTLEYTTRNKCILMFGNFIPMSGNVIGGVGVSINGVYFYKNNRAMLGADDNYINSDSLFLVGQINKNTSIKIHLYGRFYGSIVPSVSLYEYKIE